MKKAGNACQGLQLAPSKLDSLSNRRNDDCNGLKSTKYINSHKFNKIEKKITKKILKKYKYTLI